MRKIGRVGAILLLCLGGVFLLAPAPASAADPTCTSFTTVRLVETTDVLRIPSVGRNGSRECNLRQGDRNDAVRVLQYTMTCYGRNIERDRDFGPITKATLAAVQRDLQIKDDGIYGPQTRTTIRKWPQFSSDNSRWVFRGC